MPKIYLFVNQYTGRSSQWGPEDVIGIALAEDGHVLASHYSSSVSYLKHDLGLTSDWKHEQYRGHYPDGYELEWVDDASPGNHEGVDAAMEKNQQLAKEAEANE